MLLSTSSPESQFGQCSFAKWMRCRILTTVSLTRLPFWQGERGHYIHLWDAANINLILKETQCRGQATSLMVSWILPQQQSYPNNTDLKKMLHRSPKYDRKQSIPFIALCGLISLCDTITGDLSWGFLWQTRVSVWGQINECEPVHRGDENICKWANIHKLLHFLIFFFYPTPFYG